MKILWVLSTWICLSCAATFQFNEAQWIECTPPRSCSFFNSSIWLPPQVPGTLDNAIISFTSPIDLHIVIVIDQATYLDSLIINGSVSLEFNTNGTLDVEALQVSGETTSVRIINSAVRTTTATFTGYSSLYVVDNSYFNIRQGVNFGENTTLHINNSTLTTFGTGAGDDFGSVVVSNGVLNGWNCLIGSAVSLTNNSSMVCQEMSGRYSPLFVDASSELTIQHYFVASHYSTTNILGKFDADRAELYGNSSVVLSGESILTNVVMHKDASLELFSVTNTRLYLSQADGNITIRSSAIVNIRGFYITVDLTGSLTVVGESEVVIDMVDVVDGGVISDDESSTIWAKDLTISTNTSINLKGIVSVVEGGKLHLKPGSSLSAYALGNSGATIIEGSLHIEDQYLQDEYAAQTFMKGGNVTTFEMAILNGTTSFNLSSSLSGTINAIVSMNFAEQSTLYVKGDLWLQDVNIVDLLERKTPVVYVTGNIEFNSDVGNLQFSADGADFHHNIGPIPVVQGQGNVTGDFSQSFLNPFATKIENSTVYLIYSAPTPPPSGNDHLIPIVVGSVVGGVVLIAIIIGIIVLRKRIFGSKNAEGEPFLHPRG